MKTKIRGTEFALDSEPRQRCGTNALSFFRGPAGDRFFLDETVLLLPPTNSSEPGSRRFS